MAQDNIKFEQGEVPVKKKKSPVFYIVLTVAVLAAAFLPREFFAGAAGASVPLLSMASARWLMAALSSGASTVTFSSIMVCYLQNLFDVGIGALVLIFLLVLLFQLFDGCKNF